MESNHLDITTQDNFEEAPFGSIGTLVNAIILLPLAVFGLFANILTVVVITRTPALRSSVFNRFILSLCFSDLTSAVISPLFLYRRTFGFVLWRLPAFLCKTIWGLDNWTSSVTSAHILVFTLLRFISIQWPYRFRSIKISHAKVVIWTLWISSFVTSFVPVVIWSDANVINRTLETPEARWPSCSISKKWIPIFEMYVYVAYTIMFYIPITLIIALSFMIAIKIKRLQKRRTSKIGSYRKRSKTLSQIEIKRRRKERMILVQLVLIVGSFLLGYIPMTIRFTYTLNNYSVTEEHMRTDWLFGCAAYISLRVSECLNPVFYNVASSAMRAESLKTMSSCFTPLHDSFSSCSHSSHSCSCASSKEESGERMTSATAMQPSVTTV